MNALKLKAQAKKQKFYNKNKSDSSDDSDGELTEDDEEIVSLDYVNRIYNNKYVCIKYLGRGTFSRVWLVLDIIDNKYYAMKTIFSKYLEDSSHEIEVNKKLQCIKPNNILVMEDSFLDKKSNEFCIITKLLGKTMNDLIDIDLSECSDKNSENNSDENSDENSEENSENNSEENSDENSEENSEKNSDENSEENSEKNSDENSDENSEENIDENSDDNSDDNSDNSDENSEENSEKNSDENSDENSEENIDENSDDNSDDNSDNSDDNSDEDFNFISPSLKLVKKFIKDVSEGLYELHSKNMIHTDLKFENILVDILDNTIKNIINKVNKIDICNKYKEYIDKYIPENYTNLNICKKKKVKRKAKDKALKNLESFLKDNNIFKFDKNIKKTTSNIYDLEKLNFDSFKFIIIDLGNVEYNDNKDQDEIMLRSYRPPENIISGIYDYKADMWCLGCLIYELITNNYLFKIIKKKKSIDKDRYHLYKMYECLGKMPKDMALSCEFSKDLFDNKGNILKRKKYEYTDLEQLLLEESTYEESEIKEISNFLKKILVYNPEKRLSSKECYNDKWLVN